MQDFEQEGWVEKCGADLGRLNLKMEKITTLFYPIKHWILIKLAGENFYQDISCEPR